MREPLVVHAQDDRTHKRSRSATTVLARTSLDAAGPVAATQRELRAVNVTLLSQMARACPRTGVSLRRG